jgi:hypothetical protein
VDYAIHDVRHDGLNAIDRVLRDDPPAEGSINLRLLRSMQQAFFSLFTVTDVEPGLGVHGEEGPARKRRFIADIGFSRTASPGSIIATRMLSPGDGWHMTTGAALPLLPRAIDAIAHDLEAYIRRHGAEPVGAALSSVILRHCIAAGASRSIRYASVNPEDDASTVGPIRATPRIGRNDPCSCGSGKKYKKCCGR